MGTNDLHATHNHNGGFIVDEHGDVRKDLGPHIFVTPIAAAQLDDEWNVLGLRGTGSVDYSINGVVDRSMPSGWLACLPSRIPAFF